MMRKLIGLIFILIMSCTFAIAIENDTLNYIWPTNASRAFTSSFAEYRPGRFHAGVDIKTWGKTGYALFAIRDGYISRIQVSPFGYGKALYLTLDTGESVVYGHMERFIDEIEDYVWQQQNAKKEYDIRLFPGVSQFRFKQGDLIGYSGQTGVGYPHLHFEMRDQSGFPINPLDKGYKVNDYTAPVISKIAITPMDAFATVNQDWKPAVYRTSELRSNYYIIDRPVVVDGLIGFAFSAFDQMEDITNKFGTYKNQLFIDEKLIFSSVYKRFSYDENHLAALDRDFRLAQRGFGNFYQLFRDSGNSLDFYFDKQTYYGIVYFTTEYDAAYQPFAGVRAISGKTHSFRMVAQDYWGNTSQVVGKIQVSEPGPYILNERSLGVLLTNSLALSDSNMFTITPDFYDKFINIKLSPVTGIPDSLAVTYRFANNISRPLPLLRKNGALTAAIPLNVNDNGPVTLQCLGKLNDRYYRQKYKLDFETIPYSAAKTVTLPDDSCQVIFTSRSLYKPIYLRSVKLPPESNSVYKFAGGIYKIEPGDVPMHKGADIKLKIAKTDVDPTKIGVYYKVQGYNKWRFFGNRYEPATHTVSGHVGTFGTHALIIDDVPPELMYLTPSDNSHVNGITTFRAVIKDELSGIGDEKDREMRIDGAKVIAEYDPEHLTLIYKPHTPIAKGKHELEIFLRDNSGNVTTRKHFFWVD